MKIIEKIKHMFVHKYVLFKENSTILRCEQCGIFKMGPAIKDGNEIFVFNDGSCIVANKRS